MADARSDTTSGSATETDANTQGQGTESATGEDAQAEQLLGEAVDGQAAGESGQDSSQAGDADPDGAEALGDPGKQALERMKTKLREAQSRQRELEQQLATTQQPSQDTPDRDAIRAEAERAVASKYNQRVLQAEVQRAATGKLADPADALTFLDLGQFEVSEAGDVDGDAITAAVDGLVESKPYLSAQGQQRFQGTGDGGARNGSAPKQITSRDELGNMSPSERLQAYRDGRLSKLLQG